MTQWPPPAGDGAVLAGAAAPPAWAAPPAAKVRRRRRAPRLLVGLLAVAALVAGTVVAIVTATAATSPARVVREYFAALSADDAPAALSYGPAPTGDHDFLTSAALSVQQKLAAIGDVVLGAVTVSGRSAQVAVTYRLTPAAGAPSTQHSTVRLHRVGRGWQLDATAATVRIIATAAAHRATLAGAKIPAAAVELFPGAVPVQYDTGLIAQATDPVHLTLGSSGDVRVDARLSPSAVSAVEATVRRSFAGCLSRGAAAPLSCPLTPDEDHAVPGSLRGTLRHVTFDSAPSLRGTNADGLIETTGTFAVHGRYQLLNFDNIASSTAGTFTVTFRAALYASAPGVLAWEKP